MLSGEVAQPTNEDSWKRKFDALMGTSNIEPARNSAAESNDDAASATRLTSGDNEFIAEVERTVHFTFAKTYGKSYPHEYTTRRACPVESHARLIALIEKHGVVERFYDAERKYLYCGERKYWHMGDPYSELPDAWPNVINRTWLEVRRYEGDARALGYDGGELEDLARRWEVLLRRARGQ
jgi:hypothetical protein